MCVYALPVNALARACTCVRVRSTQVDVVDAEFNESIEFHEFNLCGEGGVGANR